MVLEYNIQTSSYKVSKHLTNIALAQDDILISFDVTSLYKNAPVKVIEHCQDLLYDKIPMESIDKETFITLARLACCVVVFQTHDGYYTQIHGLAMGSPPAPHLANGWISYFGNTIRGHSHGCYFMLLMCVQVSTIYFIVNIYLNLEENF